MTRHSHGPIAVSTRAARVRVLVAWLFGVTILLGLVLPASAPADLFGQISLISEGMLDGGLLQQAEYAHDVTISGDGRYVAFDGSVGGVTGVWRRDVQSGVIEQVAGGDAELPSISQEGRFISFTTTTDLVPADEPMGPNVWVRDMEPGPGEPEYTLVSAVNGSNEGLAYLYGSSPSQEVHRFGSAAVGRSAISANGQEVAFVTTAISNLVSYPQEEEEERLRGETPKPHTPAWQVAVRNLKTGTTRLISGERHEGQTTEIPVSDGTGPEATGAVYPGSFKQPGFRPVPADGYWENDPPVGASISADGSTVAWMGENIARQAQVLDSEVPASLYTEPLWRRIAPGSETPTERVTGGSDPSNPACVASKETQLPPLQDQSAADPCQGPFHVELTPLNNGSTGVWSEAGGGGEANFVPRLSANGSIVAFLGSAVPIVLGGGFGIEPQGEPADLYVANMSAGLTRDEATTALTQVGGVNVAADSPITDFEISADGQQVAFTTRRSAFTLGSPAYISAPLAEPGESELFDVDLGDHTLTRVTHGYGGEGPSEQTHGSILNCPGDEDPYCNPITIGAQSPSFSANGDLIAFSSTASNLVYGDGNSPRSPFGTAEGEIDGSDAFLVERRPAVSLPTPQEISTPPATAVLPSWRLGVSAFSRTDGSVFVYVWTPGPGTLVANARGSVLIKTAAGSARRRKRHGHSEPVHARAALRTVASAKQLVRGGELVRLTLKLAKPYAGLVSLKDGFSANVGLVFTATGHPALRQSVQVVFRRSSRHLTVKRKGKSK